jgi:spore germination protein KC
MRGRLSRAAACRGSARGWARPGLWLLLLLAAAGLSGCWYTVPLEKRGMVPLLAIDAAPGGGYEVTAAVIQPPGLPPPGPAGAGTGGGNTPVFLRSASGPTVHEAIHALTAGTYLLLDFTHLEGLLVSQAVARRGLAPALAYIARSPEFVATGWLLVVPRGTAGAVLAATAHDLPRPNEVLDLTVQWARIDTAYKAARIETALKELPMRGQDFATAGLEAIPGGGEGGQGGGGGGSSTAPFVIRGEALFRGDRLTGWLDGPGALGWAVAMGHLNHQPLTVQGGQGVFGLELLGAHRRVRVSPRGKRTPHVFLDLHVYGSLTDTVGAFGALPPGGGRLRAMETLAADRLRRDVEAGLATARADGADVFGLGEFVRLQDPGYWRRVAGHWANGAFPSLPVTVRVRVTITSVGKLLCPLLGPC